MSETVLTISDAHTVHCLTEGHIDEWWRSLPIERKIAIFQADLDGAQKPEPSIDRTSLERYCDDFLAEMEIICRTPFMDLAGLQEALRADL